MKYLYLTITCIFLFACSNQNEFLISNYDHKDETASILRFRDRKSLDLTIKKKLSVDSYGKKLSKNFQRSATVSLRAYGAEGSIETSELVPDTELSKLLNEKGEIIVNDTLYVVTPYGTFFSDPKNYNKIYEAIKDKNSHFSLKIGEDLYKIGAVYRYDTFKDVKFENQDEKSYDTDENDDSFSQLRSSVVPRPKVNLFPEVRASRHTIVGKRLQGWGIRKSLISRFPDFSKRRLNCAVFDYNYYFRQSIGLTAKIQKKMWYGSWAKVKSWEANAIQIGFENVIVRFPYPDGSSFNEIHKRILADYNLMNPSMNNDIFGPDPSDPWNQKGNMEVDLGILPMINVSLPSINDLLTIAGNHMKAYIKRNIDRNITNMLGGTYDVFLATPREQRPERLNDIIDELNYSVAVFARDGIYVVYTSGKISNENEQSEITYRFVEQFPELLLSFSSNLEPVKLSSLYKDIKPTFKNPDVKLIRGTFYACGYWNSWVGYRLYW